MKKNNTYQRSPLCLNKSVSTNFFSSIFSISECISLKVFFLSLFSPWDEGCFDYMEEDLDEPDLGELTCFSPLSIWGSMRNTL
jgi:hypothetical protein